MLPLVNLQEPEKQLHVESPYVDVIKVWDTIQGEGPFAGTPAVFVRLAGCNLKCPKCDTNYTKGRGIMTPVDVVREIAVRRKKGLIVVTGGEPFRQPIGPLVRAILMTGDYHVQIETNGTLFQEDFPWWAPDCTIVCSPKTPKLHPELANKVHAYKYILDANNVDPHDGLPSNTMGLAMSEKVARPPEGVTNDKVYVQPLDSNLGTALATLHANQQNQRAAVESCRIFGYRLSLQLHKILGLE